MDLQTLFNGEILEADLALDAGDLATDHGLATAIVISLFTDARARSDDELPAGETDQRGWWGDVVSPANAPADRPWMTGSRLWLLSRAKQTPETARRAEHYAREALAWVTAGRYARAAEVAAFWSDAILGRLDLVVTVTRPDGTPERFSFLWRQPQ